MLQPIDEKTAKTLIDDRYPSQRIGDSFVYRAKTGGWVSISETECLHYDAPRETVVNETIPTPFD